MESNKKIILCSSGDPYSVENKATHFQNLQFDTKYLDINKSYDIFLRYIAVHLQFKNPVISHQNKLPCVIVVTNTYLESINRRIITRRSAKKRKINNPTSNVLQIDNDDDWVQTTYVNNSESAQYEIISKNNESTDLEITDFKFNQKYFLEENKSYTIKEMIDKWRLFERENESVVKEQLNLKESFNTFNSLSDHGYCLIGGYNFALHHLVVNFWHYKFVKKLGLDDKNRFDGVINISGDNYYYYVNNKTRQGIKIDLDNQGLKFDPPALMKIVCEQISPYITQDSYSKIIGVVDIDSKDRNKIMTHTFKGNEVFQLEHTENSHFEIKLLDEYNRRIQIGLSLPTIVELNATPSKMSKFNIRGDSGNNLNPSNKPSKFKIILPKGVEINKQWKCALSSISFRNNFHYNQFLDLSFDMFAYTGILDESGNIRDDDIIYSISKTKIDDSCTDVRKVFNNFKQTIEDVKHRHNEGSQGKVANFIFTNSRRVIIEANFNMSLRLSPDLARILGFTTVIDRTNEKMVITLKAGNRYITSSTVDNSYTLKDQFMYVSCNFLDFIPWGGTMSRILKTINIPNEEEKEGQYITINFDNLDFMSIENTHLNELDFALLNHSGEELSFKDTTMYNDTNINLVFKRFPLQ